jgi:hypothetical protein
VGFDNPRRKSNKSEYVKYPKKKKVLEERKVAQSEMRHLDIYKTYKGFLEASCRKSNNCELDEYNRMFF